MLKLFLLSVMNQVATFFDLHILLKGKVIVCLFYDVIAYVTHRHCLSCNIAVKTKTID